MANLSFIVTAMWEAMILRMAVGIPIGRSLEGSVSSLWRQKRYVSVKNLCALVEKAVNVVVDVDVVEVNKGGKDVN